MKRTAIRAISELFGKRSTVLDCLESASLWGLRLFLLLVGLVTARNGPSLFTPSKGRSHRFLGGLCFAWIVVGSITWGEQDVKPIYVLSYDIVLGCLTTLVTLSAARNFPHKLVRNQPGQSGALDERATVTQAEMLEHAFYQVLNLVQILYLHIMASISTNGSNNVTTMYGALILVTSPWWFRRSFPVNSFSANWKKENQQTPRLLLLYRIKKTQYLFYKHYCLHGLNIIAALSSSTSVPFQLPYTRAWRIFWIHLNTSYVFEFFLQSLVKRKVLSQQDMLGLNRLLITSASLSALMPIFGTVPLWVGATSLILNLLHRHHDVQNTLIVATIAKSFINVG